MDTKTVAPHVASVVAIIAAVLAAVHPGFTLPPNTSEYATTILVTVAGIIQVITAFFHTNNHAKAVVLKQLTTKVLSESTKPLG